MCLALPLSWDDPSTNPHFNVSKVCNIVRMMANGTAAQAQASMANSAWLPGGSSFSSGALSQAASEFGSSLTRPHAKKIVVLSTDGYPASGRRTARAAKALKNQGVKLITLAFPLSGDTTTYTYPTQVKRYHKYFSAISDGLVAVPSSSSDATAALKPLMDKILTAAENPVGTDYTSANGRGPCIG